ncbi:MAG: Thymidylate synthase ThyX [Actinobacteria bacterium ADurb.Bin346]|nr:MAG: Thymidylate synthase ThyX [Actinobacteria bacterium ADurb.Bin346]
MKVKLIKYTPEPEKMVAVAARLCYSPIGGEQLLEDLETEEAHKLVRFVVKSGHLSTTEHITFTFAIEGVSRALTHQLVRHRLASYNQQSQRYVKFTGNYEYITPPAVKNNPAVCVKYDKFVKNIHNFYGELIEAGIEPEDARYILPSASETKIIVTMNGRELLHFFTVRCCNRAQWEIRELATIMLKLVRKVCPVVFEKAGPNCLRGPCPEGKFSCGNPPDESDFNE